MKIAYVTTYDVFNQATWLSNQLGLCQAGYHIAKTLSQNNTSLHYIGNLQKRFSVLTRLKWSIYRFLLKKDYYRWAEPLVVKDYSHQVNVRLAKINPDLVICTENVIPIAYLKSNWPIVLWTDATLGSLINFYPHLTNLCQETANNIYKIEKAALERCKLAIYTSEWAAETAIDIYSINPSKIKVVPWGANIECNRNIDDIKYLLKLRPYNSCKLLFFGTEWFRKGGDIALAVTQELNSRGLNTQLTVVGCETVSNKPLPKFANVLGYIDKYSQSGQERINQLLSNSHFIILPSKAETYGHVFCEANSFGVPCLATNVGGIPTVIKNGLNGKTFTTDANIAEYCDYIISLMTDYQEYTKLAISSFKEYQTRLNWGVACQEVKNLLIDLIGR